MNVSVLGAGPHGHQVASLFAAEGHTVRLYDDTLTLLPATDVGARRAPWVIGAAWPQVRAGIAARVGQAPEPYDGGRVVFPGARVGTDVTLGVHVHVEWNASVCHGCTVGDYVTLCPGVVLAGEATIEPGAFVGANATVIHGGVTVGAGAFVGAGSVALDDIPPGQVWAGNPARKVADAWDHREMAQGGRRRARLALPDRS